MRKLVTLIVVAIFSTFSVKALATETTNFDTRAYNYGKSFIFVENGITFSVYPDGEFDFYIDNRSYLGANVNLGNVNISFNSGFRYDSYVQYDDYGAVIQIENTPIYYDFHGRVSRIGGINIFYNRGRLTRVGGLYVHYNPYGAFTHCTGFINVYNRRYIYRPYHRYFARPAANFCVVNYRPYRRYYTPVRYTYYRPYRNNFRRSYARFGNTYHYRSAHPRTKIYRNDKRVSSRRDSHVMNDVRRRSTNTYNKKQGYASRRSTNSTTHRSGGTFRKDTPQRRIQSTHRNNSIANKRPVTVHRKTTVNRGNNSKVVKRTTTMKTPQRTVQRKSTTTMRTRPNAHVTKRTVTKRTAPTVKRSVVRKPQTKQRNSVASRSMASRRR